jgi:hypothetical protein
VQQEPWRTVRNPGADGPRSPCGRSATHGRLSVKHEQNDQTNTSTSGRSVPCPWTVREQLVPRGQSATSGRAAKHPPLKSNWPTGSKPTRNEHEEHLDKLLHADSPRAPHGRSARHGNSSPNLKPKPPKLLLVHGSPKRLELLRKDLGKM